MRGSAPSTPTDPRLKFTMELNVEDADPAAYRNLIEGLRNALETGKTYHPCPILAMQTNPPVGWFDVKLQTAGEILRLRIRCDNLYIIGYQSQHSNKWKEFRNELNQPLLDNSEWLDVPISYGKLHNLARKERLKLGLGQVQLITAVKDLANPEKSIKEKARGLLTVSYMFPEATRFDFTLDMAVDYYAYGGISQESGSHLLLMIMALATNWGKISGRLLLCDLHRHTYTFQLPQPNDMGIITEEDAVEKIGILLRSVPLADAGGGTGAGAGPSGPSSKGGLEKGPSGPSSGAGPSGPSSSKGGLEKGPSGPSSSGGRLEKGKERGKSQEYPSRMLAEIFSVRIYDIVGHVGQLQGELKIFDGMSVIIIGLVFPDTSNLSPSSEGDKALLFGPLEVIEAADDFMGELNLWDNETSLSQDEETPFLIEWARFDPWVFFDEPRDSTIECKFGTVEAKYVVMQYAGAAHIQITLLNGARQNPANLFGNITANNSLGKIMLFETTGYDSVEVYPQRVIPLLRAVMAVPVSGSLVIDIDIWDYNSNLSCCDQIAKDAVEFLPDYLQESKTSICGPYGEVEVTVSWD